MLHLQHLNYITSFGSKERTAANFIHATLNNKLRNEINESSRTQNTEYTPLTG